jgi:hypothetical protein
MPITARDRQALDHAYAEFKGKYEGRKEDYFALLYLCKRFKVDAHETAHRIAFKGNDYGLDAYYVDHEARNLYLYQFKWSESFDQFKDSMIRLRDSGINHIFGNAFPDDLENDLLKYLKKDLKEARELIDRVYFHFVFKGDVEAAEKSEGLTNRTEDLTGKKYLLDAYFGREVELQIDFISDKPGRKAPPPTQSYEVTLSQHLETSHEGIKMLVGFVPLRELYSIYFALREQFFDRNIRGALSDDNSPNKKIREALDNIVIKSSEEPSIFAFKHNGVTLAAEKATSVNGHIRLHVPRVLNGAQRPFPVWPVS